MRAPEIPRPEPLSAWFYGRPRLGHPSSRMVANLAIVLLLASCKSTAPPAQRSTTASSSTTAPSAPKPIAAATDREDPESYTNLLIHNVIIITAAQTRLSVKWMRGRMYPTKPGVPPSFDDMASFRLEITDGLMGMNMNDLSHLLRNGALKNSSLRNLKIQTDGTQMKITGSLKKIIRLPFQMNAEISASPDHRKIRLHTVKLSVLKLPFKTILGVFRLHTADLFNSKHLDGVTVSGDDIDIDVSRLVPEPLTHGKLTEVRLWKTGELMEYYGEPREDAIQVRQWRNFMRLRGGTVSFGKLTMHNCDLLLVDVSQSDWMTFDVNRYQEQLVNGETHITPTAGLQIFIPDPKKIPPSRRNQDIGLQWMKNRNVTPPPEVQ